MLASLRRTVAVAAALLASTAVACAPDAEDGAEDEALDVAALTAPRTLAIDEDPAVLVEHPETLAALEASGLDLGTLLAGARFGDNRAFAASPEGASILETLDGDIAGAKAKDRAMGVGMAFAHRAFDTSWLRSDETRFELVAVANRTDRRHADASACGETHLVYRLAYANRVASSRLPMTLMLVYPQAKTAGGCAATAARWLSLPRAGTPQAKARALSTGPLARLGRASKVELNVQLVRWPSTTRTDMGGHAEYDLRVLERRGPGLTPVKLENTPRADLSADERAGLARWVSQNVAGIAAGTASVPTAFLAEQVVSVAPKGLSRGANRPYATLFGKDGAGLGDLDLAAAGGIGSREGLVRRLDTMTCQGCHQARSVAGFHALGHDRAEMSVVNALVDGMSPHLQELKAFRRADLDAVARGDTRRAAIPFAERASRYDGYGAACGTGAAFASWTCGEGLRCSNLHGDDVGMCVSSGAREAGEACEESTVSFSADSHADKVRGGRVLSCSLPGGRAGRCVRSGGTPGGFPTGMCSGGCATVGKVEGDAICGVSVPSGFNACIGAGRPFEQCIAGGSKQYRRACSAKAPCGQDYVCSAVPGAPAGVGACMPPYFLFQARVDGHLVDD